MTAFTVLCLILKSRVTCVGGNSTYVASTCFPDWVIWRVCKSVTLMSIFEISGCTCRVRKRGDLGELSVMRREFGMGETVVGDQGVSQLACLR
jgi:hypothetical protein